MLPPFNRNNLVRLPLSLARLYGNAFSAGNARGQHDNAFYLFEATIKMAAAVLVSTYRAEIDGGEPRVSDFDRLLESLALPSLGQWVAILRELARHFGGRTDAAAHPLGHFQAQLETPLRDRPALLALYRRVKNGPDGTPAGDTSCSPLQVLEVLVQYRNLVFGHGGPRPQEFYDREMGPLLYPAVDELLTEGVFDFLGPRGSRLVYLTDLRLLDGGRVEVGLRELVGLQSERMAPLVLSADQARALAPNRVGVHWPGRPTPLRLDPLLIYRERELTEEVLFLNCDRRGRQVEYLSYTTGRTERDKAMASPFAEFLGRVLGRPVTPERLEQLAQQSRAEAPPAESLLADAPPQARLLGDYQVLATLGAGGMGVVFLARQLSLGRLVALKTLPPDLAGDEVALARFQREIRLLARCDHPHIIKVLDSGTLPDGQLYYTMEYIPGCDLEHVWRELKDPAAPVAASLSGASWSRAVLTASRKWREELSTPRRSAEASPAPPPLPLPPLPDLTALPEEAGGYVRHVTALIRDAARALQAVHDQHLIHRDVKPANLMLTADGSHIVLMDFGLAKGDSRALTKPGDGNLKGTLRYAAPEQLAAATLQVGPAADVRALGVTLWELLTRRRLFADAADETELAKRVYGEDVPRLRTLDATLSRDLEAIVARATERRVEDRLPTAALLAEYLQMYLDEQPLPIRPPGFRELLWRWMREHRPLVASAAAALAIAVLSAVVAFVLITRSRDDAVQLAGEKSQLAVEKSVLADENGRLAREKSQLADDRQTALDQVKADAHQIGQLAADEHRAREQAQDRLERQFVREGVQRMEAGDLLGALPFFAEPIRLRREQPELQVVHRARLAAVTRQAPRLLHLWTHDGPVNHAEFSPDGKYVVTASDDGTAQVWDVETGDPVGPALRHDERGVGRRQPVAPLILVGLMQPPPTDTPAQVPKPPAPRLYAAPPSRWADGRIYYAAFSPDSRFVVTVSDRANWARVWEVGTGKPQTPYLKVPEADSVNYSSANQAHFSPDGRYVVVAGEKGLAQLWSVSTGEPVWTKPVKHGATINAARFAPAGTRLLTASDDGTVRLWETKTAAPAGVLPVGAPVEWAEFSPDGSQVLTAGSRAGVRLWNAATGQPAAGPFVSRGNVAHATFSPDGQVVGAAYTDGVVRVWDARSGQPVGLPLSSQGPPRRVAFSPDGGWVAAAGRDAGQIWNARWSLPAVGPLPGADKLVTFSPDGRRLVTVSQGLVRCWDIAVYDSPRPVPPPLDDPVAEAAYSADGRWLAVSRRLPESVAGWRLRVIDQKSGRPVEARPIFRWQSQLGTLLAAGPRPWQAAAALSVGPDPILSAGEQGLDGASLLFAPGGQRLLAYSLFDLYLFDLPAGRLAAHTRAKGAWHASFSPDGQWVAFGAMLNDPQLWNPETGEVRTLAVTRGEARDPDDELLFTPKLSTWHIEFSPDGRKLLTVSSTMDGFAGADAFARVWDAATLKPLTPAVALEGDARFASFSGDGQRLVTADGKRAACVWDATTGRPLTPPMRLQGGVGFAAFSRDGRYVITAGGWGLNEFGAVRVWDARTGEAVGPAMMLPRTANRADLDSASGRILAVSSSSSGTYQAWSWRFGLDERSLDELLLQARWSSGFQINDAGGYVEADLRAARDEMRAKGILRPTPPGAADVLAWYEQQAGQFEALGQWTAALWQLDRYVQLNPDAPWRVQNRRGRAAFEAGRWGATIRYLTLAIERGSTDPESWQRRGNAAAQLGRWDAAAADLAAALTRSTDRYAGPLSDGELKLRTQLALAHLARQDRAAYRAACNKLLERLGDDVLAGDRLRKVTEVCLLRPDTVDDWKKLVALQREEWKYDLKKPEVLILLGETLFRAGEFEAAGQAFQQADDATASGPSVYTALFQVMLMRRLGQEEAAGKLMAQIRQWFGRNLPEPAQRFSWLGLPMKLSSPAVEPAQPEASRFSWEDRVEWRQLRGEAEELLKKPAKGSGP